MVDPATGLEQNTNDFKFTWCIDASDSSHVLKRTVVPQTYSGMAHVISLLYFLKKNFRGYVMDRREKSTGDGSKYSRITNAIKRRTN